MHRFLLFGLLVICFGSCAPKLNPIKGYTIIKQRGTSQEIDSVYAEYPIKLIHGNVSIPKNRTV